MSSLFNSGSSASIRCPCNECYMCGPDWRCYSCEGCFWWHRNNLLELENSSGCSIYVRTSPGPLHLKTVEFRGFHLLVSDLISDDGLGCRWCNKYEGKSKRSNTVRHIIRTCFKEDVHPCNLCGKLIKRYDNYVNHMRQQHHHWRCLRHDCNNFFPVSPENLQDEVLCAAGHYHRRCAHLDVRCDAYYHLPPNVYEGRCSNRHDGHNSYVCETCGMAFPSRMALERHKTVCNSRVEDLYQPWSFGSFFPYFS